MMLGIPARSSIAVPSGRRNHGGDNSVRNNAMPKLTGIPIDSAIIEVINVPTMGTNAPNFSVTGFQSALKRKSNPKALMAGVLPIISEPISAASNAKTTNVKNQVTL